MNGGRRPGLARRPGPAVWTRLAVRSGLVVLCGLLVVGCSGSDEPARPDDLGSPRVEASTTAAAATAATGSGPASGGSTPTGPAVSCAQAHNDTAPLNDRYQLVLETVAVPILTLVPNESSEPGWLFAKQGLVVRAGTPVDIAVAPEAVGRVRVGWGSSGPEGSTIHVPACPSGNGSGWLAFIGGYHVSAPTCVPLVIRVGGREERAGVRVGATC